MNEAVLSRMLRQYRKVRGPDYHQPATRDSQGKIENGDGIEKRQPLTKEERAEAEKILAAGGTVGSSGSGDHLQQASVGGVGGDGIAEGGEDLIEPGNFFKEFDAWVDSKYPGDRVSATKMKVAFRKQHRAMVATLCLEDIEAVAQAMQ